MENILDRGLSILPLILVVIAIIILVSTGMKLIRILSTIALVGGILVWCVVLPLRDTDSFIIGATDIATTERAQETVMARVLKDKSVSEITNLETNDGEESLDFAVTYNKYLLNGYVSYTKHITYRIDKELLNSEHKAVEASRTISLKQLWSNLKPKVNINKEKIKSEFDDATKVFRGEL